MIPRPCRRCGPLYRSIDDVDTMIGLFAETPPEGFGFSDTAFRIFILMASRRIQSDRFLTVDFRPEIYSPLGMDWVAAERHDEHHRAALPEPCGFDAPRRQRLRAVAVRDSTERPTAMSAPPTPRPAGLEALGQRPLLSAIMGSGAPTGVSRGSSVEGRLDELHLVVAAGSAERTRRGDADRDDRLHRSDDARPPVA